MTFSTDDKRAALEREIRMRKRVYPRWVQEGRMRAEVAEREIRLMEAILADYPPAQGRML